MYISTNYVVLEISLIWSALFSWTLFDMANLASRGVNDQGHLKISLFLLTVIFKRYDGLTHCTAFIRKLLKYCKVLQSVKPVNQHFVTLHDQVISRVSPLLSCLAPCGHCQPWVKSTQSASSQPGRRSKQEAKLSLWLWGILLSCSSGR
jgi:hypothetical protein